MSWHKRYLFSLLGAAGALALMGMAGWYFSANREAAAQNFGQSKEAHPGQAAPNVPGIRAGSGKVESQKPVTGLAARGVANEAGVIRVKYRAINADTCSPAANTAMAFAVLDELKRNPMIDAEATRFDSDLSTEEAGTFTFRVVIKMKKPLKL